MTCPAFIFLSPFGHFCFLKNPGEVHNPYLLGLGTKSLFIEECLLSRTSARKMVRTIGFRGKNSILVLKFPPSAPLPEIFRLAELILKYLRKNITKGLPVLATQQTR